MWPDCKYGSDPIWLPMLPTIAQRMPARIAETIGTASSDYLLIEREGSVVGVSGIAESHSTDQNSGSADCALLRSTLGEDLLPIAKCTLSLAPAESRM